MSATSPVSQFDVGPLTWVKSEIDLALDRATQALKLFGANPQDSTQIKFCRTHLHQVRGALAIVGLDGVTKFADALEGLLADIEEGRQPADGSRIALLGTAVAMIYQYLDDLIAGEPDQPLRLFPVYSQLVLARGLPAPAGSELFFPDLSLRPGIKPMAPLAAGAGPQKMRTARARFQKGLLTWLKDPQQPSGPQELQLAAVEISGADEAPVLRAFWWAVSGLFAAVAERKVADEAQVKHLLPRIDQQIRRQFEGSRTVPERLMRDVLYNVAICRSERAVVKEIRRTYGLDGLIPAAAAAGAQGPQVELILKRLREIATGAEDAWTKFCGGTATALTSFREASATLNQGSQRLDHTDLRRLTQALAATAAWIAERSERQSEVLSIEMATAVLLIGNAIDNFHHLGADFVHQVDVMVARLHACMAGNPPPPDAELPGLDEMSRRAQERMLIAQVVREIKSNLGQIEQALDTFFRDATQRDALDGLKGPLHQIEGALTILGQEAAVRALRDSGSQISRFAAADYQTSHRDFEAVAHQLSALGFFVESLQSGNVDYDQFVRQLDAGPGIRRTDAADRFSATEEAPKAATPRPAAETTPVAAAVATAAPAMATGPVAIPQPTAIEVLPPAPAPLGVESSAEPPAIASPAPEVHASAEEVDAELLEIFLEEAGEVLATIAESLQSLSARPGDGEALTTVRRAFHTLKGSSRMVGLKDFGEVAWSVEQVHNLWLRQEMKVSVELLDLIRHAHEIFSAWVAHLASGDGGIPDATPLVAQAEKLRGIETAPETPPQPVPEIPESRWEDVIETHVPAAEASPEPALAEAAAAEPAAAPTSIDFGVDETAAEPGEVQAETVAEIATGEPEPTIAAETPDLIFDLGTAEEAAPTAVEPEAWTLEVGEPEPLPVSEPVAAEEIGERQGELPAEVAIDETEPETAEPAEMIFDLGAANDAEAMPELAKIDEAPPIAARTEEWAVEIGEPEMAPEVAPVLAEEVGERLAEAIPEIVTGEPEAEFAEPPELIFDLGAADDAEAMPEPAEIGEAPAIAATTEEWAVEIGEPETAPEIAPVLAEGIGERPAEVAPEIVTGEPEAESAEPPELIFDIGAEEPGAAPETAVTAPELDFETQFTTSVIEAAEPPAEISETPTAVPQQTITISPTLHEIFIEEARDHLKTLQELFGELEISPSAATDIDMVRAAHTLGSIGGTVGFMTIKRLGHGLEDALLRRNNSNRRDSLEALETLRLTIAELEQMVAAVGAGEAPSDHTELADALAGLYPLVGVATGEMAPEAGLLTPAPQAADDELAEDRLDESLLPIFLEEAADLISGVTERLSMWRRDPADVDSIHALARLLHTLKGSARMTGAMRIGALTHGLESRIEQAYKAGEADPGQIAEIETEFDEIALLVDDLRLAPAAADLVDAVAAEAPPVAETAEASEVPAALAEPAIVQAPPPAPAEPVPADHLDEQLLPIFLEEAAELTQTVYEQLDTLAANPEDPQAARGLARALHTIKGSARMAGAMSLGFLTHTLETRIDDASRTGTPNLALVDEIRSTFDNIAAVIEGLQRGAIPAPPEVVAPVPAVVAEAAPEVLPLTAPPASAETGEATPAPGEIAAPAEADAALAVAARAKDEAAPKPMLRVRAEMIDHLVNDAGELSIARSRIEGEMRSLKQSLLDLTENVIRLRRQLREVEIQAESQMQSKISLTQEASTQFDPLELDRFTRFQELTRMMAESVNDVATVQLNLLRNLDEANAALSAQSRLNRELQQQLMAIRMVPFASITERLYRIVRQTARELGKRTDLEIKGSQIELDQNVINKMIGPFEHLLRNAIAHGIEDPAVRSAAGKGEMGEIVLTLRHEGNEVVITMEDDGGGLHFEKIRAKAIARGLLGADEPVDEKRLAGMIFQSGFSTASEITQVSGRGVGMDVVKTEVASLGGRIDVSSTAGKGSIFRIYLPLTLAVTNAVLIRVGTRVFAVPASMIDQVQEIREEALTYIRDAGQAEWQGHPYPFAFLPHLLGEADALPESRKRYWVMLLHSGAQRTAIQIDELLGTQEIVVKNIGPQLARVVGIAGATVLGDGRVVLILNPVALAARRAVATVAGTVAEPVAAEVVEEQVVTLPTVFVVDDSLTVRKITGRLLAREGYQVVSAKDGVDALEQLTELTPDVIISDIEMPRMDGFELARNIRSDARLHDIPIIMITSRTAEKHRSHAFELGVNDYLGKPYGEEELLGLVAGYIARKRGKAHG